MDWLLLSVLFNSGIFVLFRYYGRWQLPLLPVVVINYWVCLAIGVGLGAPLFSASTYQGSNWWILGMVQGGLFVTFFFLIGLSTARNGIAYTTVVTKLSVLVPVLVALMWFGERLGLVQWAGVVCALVSVFLVNARKDGQTKPRSWVLGSILFIGTGIIDSNFKVFDFYFANQTSFTTFLTFVFGVAAAAGSAALATGVQRLRPHSLLRVGGAGLLLGAINYLAVLSLLRGLNTLPAALFFPANNVGQLLLASATGLWLFGERFSNKNWVGIALALAAILLLTLAA